MGQSVGFGYIAQTEANVVTVRPGPNVVFLALRRCFEAEEQQTTMFTEMSPGHVMQLIRELQSSVRVALGHKE